MVPNPPRTLLQARVPAARPGRGRVSVRCAARLTGAALLMASMAPGEFATFTVFDEETTTALLRSVDETEIKE